MTRAILVLTAAALCACSSTVTEPEREWCREVVSLPSPDAGDEATLSLEDATDCECFVDPPSADITVTFDAEACECSGVFVGPSPGRLRLEGECER